MGLFGKKKADKDEKKPSVKKAPEPTGSPWIALIVIGFCVLAGSFFWVYGKFISGEKVELKWPESRMEKTQRVREVTPDQDGTIIFRKED